MKAQEAFDQLDPQAWAKTSAQERLQLIDQLRENILQHAQELGRIDAEMKSSHASPGAVSPSEGMGSTVNAMGNTLSGIRFLYQSLVNGPLPKSLGVRQLPNDIYEVEVYPQTQFDKLAAQKLKGFLHVKGQPKQTNPLEKPSGVIAVLGAGNYSSSIEMAMALFLENKAVVHKPHQLNEATDEIWAKIFAPLIKRKAVAFCDADQGQALTAVEGLHSIYFTGSTGVAHAIQDAAKAPLVSECGGNNPCIVVPGSRTWTPKEIQHHAVQLVSIGKLNGGAVCGRLQTIVTSKNWPQREEFLDAVRKAIVEDTFAVATYYPNVGETKAKFLEHHPEAETLKPENGRLPNSDVVFIPNVGVDDFAVKNEAFCQVFNEVPLDTTTNPEDFLTAATDFCNNKLLGTLGCMIIVDNETLSAKRSRVDQAVQELHYGGIAVNNAPPNIWLNAYLTWGGCGESTEDFVSGVGNFGNALNFENVVKSVIVDDFMAASFSMTNRRQFNNLLVNASRFSVEPKWGTFAKLAGQMIFDGFRKKDF